MSDLVKLEVFLRGGAVATLLLCFVLFALRNGANRKDFSVAALCLGLCSYVLVSSPGVGINTGIAFVVLAAVAALVPVLVYWAAMELFHDEFTFAYWQMVVCGLIIGSAWLSPTSGSWSIVRGTCVVVIFVQLIKVILQGEADDLVEMRRRSRRWFLLIISIVVLAITALEITGVDRALPAALYLAHAALFWVLAAAFLLWAIRVDPGVWLATRPNRASIDGLHPAQRALINRIEVAMSDGLWRHEGLTVSDMARTLNSQEHRIRAAITQGLGHRNFSSFVNRFRIAKAKEILSDPAMAEQTILSIAFSVGFASLGPFNRAFRENTGMTPTEFRQLTAETTTGST